VSKGFFADSSLYKFSFNLTSGESISRDFFEQRNAELAEEDQAFDIYEEPRGFLTVNHKPRLKDISESQVAIIEYHEFERGVSEIEIPSVENKIITSMRLICESVDRSGPSGQIDVATVATYCEAIVGSDEYENAEFAIMGVELDGEIYPVQEAKFENAHSRVWLWVYDSEEEKHGLDFFGSQTLPDPWVAEIIDLNVENIKEGFDQDLNQLLKVDKFFNQKDLDWIKNNQDFVSQYQKSHHILKHMMSSGELELELPTFTKENVKVSTCTLLCMFFDAFGVAGYDPRKISQQDEMDMHLLTLETLALGNETLLKSVQKSFCIHFNLISEVSLGEEESFSEMSNPTLADAIEFVEQVLDDPDATFNQS